MLGLPIECMIFKHNHRPPCYSTPACSRGDYTNVWPACDEERKWPTSDSTGGLAVTTAVYAIPGCNSWLGTVILTTYFFSSASSPAYLSDLFTMYIPSRQPRSSADTRTLRIPHVRSNTLCQSSFMLEVTPCARVLSC